MKNKTTGLKTTMNLAKQTIDGEPIKFSKSKIIKDTESYFVKTNKLQIAYAIENLENSLQKTKYNQDEDQLTLRVMFLNNLDKLYDLLDMMPERTEELDKIMIRILKVKTSIKKRVGEDVFVSEEDEVRINEYVSLIRKSLNINIETFAKLKETLLTSKLNYAVTRTLNNEKK